MGQCKPTLYDHEKTRTHAYWVNSLSLPFTCFGRVVTKWSNRPSTILSFSSFALHQLIANELKRTDDELADLQTQYNELSYYMRVHNVQDYGYNTVAAYHWHIQRQRDSLQTVNQCFRKHSTQSSSTCKTNK